MTGGRPVIVGTRKSALALRQTQNAVEALKRFFPEQEFRIHTIQTAGDRVTNWASVRSEVGIFVKEIEEALLGNRIDMAVHSLKDMPCDLPEGLTLGAVGERVCPQDALLSNGHVKFNDLKAGARIGTSSIRRRAQILHSRKDLAVGELRGNVDTRIRKLQARQTDAIVIAAAGVIRLGLERHITELMPADLMLPAPCQGAIAVEIRENDPRMSSILRTIDHEPTRACTCAERAFLKRLGAGCRVPVGALAVCENGRLTLTAEVISPSGDKTFRRSAAAAVSGAELLGNKLADEMLGLDGGVDSGGYEGT